MAARKIRKGKKRWYTVQAPKIFNNQNLGETVVWEVEELKSKSITVNLMTLSGNPKKQNMNVYFKVSSVEENVAKTKTIGIEMQQSSVKRLVRRGRSKVADSFLSRTKKGQLVRIKPIVMTRSLTDAATQSALRKRCRQLINEALSKYSFDTVISDIANMRLQKHLKDQLSAIFPVRSVDIRYMRFAKVDSEEEPDLEESAYEERPRRERIQEEDAEGLKSLRDELDEALAAEKDVPSKKSAKKASKKAVADDEDEDEEE